MKLNPNQYEIAMRSRFVAPTFGGARGGVCPQAGVRSVVDGHTWALAPASMVSFPQAGATAAAMGDRTWSPLIS